jgi:methylase of polypeptide subunit release factors
VTALEKTLIQLRDYLSEVGFVQVFKYIASINHYPVNPYVVGEKSRDHILRYGAYSRGPREDFAIASCLMIDERVSYVELSDPLKKLADQLLEVELLTLDDDEKLHMGNYQLIAISGMPLFVDRRVNFNTSDVHEVYFGIDTLLLCYYVDTLRLNRQSPVLDLGTGTGLIGFYLSQFTDRVTVTDIMPEPLKIVHMNRLLNGKTGTIEVCEETFDETFDRGKKYEAVTFNPPYVVIPPELKAPIFARGVGPDGLGYSRMLIERLDDVLAPGGVAYLVSSMLGTPVGPYFEIELRNYVEEKGLQIDLFCDAREDYTENTVSFRLLAGLLHQENPEISPKECEERLRVLHTETLGAQCNLLTVATIRRADRQAPRLRVFNRWLTAPHGAMPAQ